MKKSEEVKEFKRVFKNWQTIKKIYYTLNIYWKNYMDFIDFQNRTWLVENDDLSKIQWACDSLELKANAIIARVLRWVNEYDFIIRIEKLKRAFSMRVDKVFSIISTLNEMRTLPNLESDLDTIMEIGRISQDIAELESIKHSVLERIFELIPKHTELHISS